MRNYILHLLVRKNRKDAINNGINPTLIVIISCVLWSGMGFIGFMVGFYIGGRVAAYICAIVFTALGGYISHVIANHSFVDYTPRKNNMLMRRYSYISNDYFMPWANVQLIYAQITIVQENSNSAPPAAWEFFLNGRKAGKAKDGSPVTLPTGSRNNVLVARDDKGALSPPFEFSVKSGRHSEVLFSEGRFAGAKDIGRMSLSGIRQSSGRRSRAGSAGP